MLTIKMGFCDEFSELYNSFTTSDKGKEFLRLDGIQRQNLDFPSMSQKFFNEHIGDVSVSPNSNVGDDKNPITYAHEIASPLNKLMGIYTLWQQLHSDYGLETANDLIKKLIIGTFYFHDSTRMMVPYCFAASTSSVLFEGRPYSTLQSKPPKRLRSFVGAVTEYAMDLSQSFCGAIALGDFLVNMAWFTAKDKLSDKDIENELQSFTHVMQNPFRIGGDSPFTNLSIFDEPNIKNLFKDYKYPDGNSPCDEPWLSEIKRVQKIFMRFMAKKDPATGYPYRFPVTTLNVFVEDGKVVDNEFLDHVSTYNKEGLFNVFITDDVAKLASCCRLQSSLTDLLRFRGIDSFGNGGLNVGSTRVVTLNFYRLCRRFKGKPDEFDTYLTSYLDGAAKILKSHRNLLRGLVDRGFLKFFKMGWIDLDRMFFSTIGITGIWEGFKELGMDVLGEDKQINDPGLTDACGTFQKINKIVEELSVKYEMPINIEQIPAESAAITLAKKDKLFFNDEKQAYTLYANQFIPLWENVNLWTRAKVDGTLDKFFNGGVISHLNINSTASKANVKRLIKFAVDCNLSHFALNPVFSKCEECDNVVFGQPETCDKCGGTNFKHMTRIVGYFTPVDSWNKTRREWEFEKRQWKGLQ